MSSLERQEAYLIPFGPQGYASYCETRIFIVSGVGHCFSYTVVRQSEGWTVPRDQASNPMKMACKMHIAVIIICTTNRTKGVQAACRPIKRSNFDCRNLLHFGKFAYAGCGRYPSEATNHCLVLAETTAFIFFTIYDYIPK